jgi:hypothetical protein
MKLPIPFIKSNKSNNQYYLALILDDEKTSSVILEESEGKLIPIGKHEESLPSSVEGISQDELITIIDKTISRAEEVLPPDVETHKTVFGVKENWVDPETKKIKKEYLTKLKKMCDALDLSPIGFMVISEAIANLLQTDEGAPLSAILVELGRKKAHVTLFRGGHITESVSGHLEHSAVTTVDNLLKRFTTPVLPAKIILAFNKDAHGTAQHFINHEWSKSLPFLHVPQVSVLPEDFDARAITHGAAQQMGFEVLEDKKQIVPEVVIGKDNPDIDMASSTPTIPAAIAGDNFGFVADQDIASRLHNSDPVEAINDDKHIDDLQNSENDKELESESLHHSVSKEKINNDELNADVEPLRQTRRDKKTDLFAGAMAYAKSLKLPKALTLPKNLKIPQFVGKNKGIKIGLIVVGVLLLLSAAFSAFYFNNVKANIILAVEPKEVNQEENVTFSTSAGNDFSKNIIAAKKVSAEIDGEASTNATGKKDTGEKAKGSVTIFNSANREVNLSKDTTITSSNDLSFTLEKDIKIASASGDIFTGTKPGTQQVAVIAKEIGTDSNLPSNTKFTVSGNSSLAAKNDNAFSGGSKKTITVVSRNDLAKLRSELPKSLEKKALEELSAKNSSSEVVLPSFVKVSITEEDFDKKVDDEAKQVKLKAKVKFESISYQNNDLEDFDKSILKDRYTDDITFAKGSLKNDLKNIKVKNENESQGTLLITAGILPKINNREVADKLKDKSESNAKEILSSLPQVIDSEIKYSPNIFFLAKLFPRLPNNLIVTIKTD